MQVIAQHPIPVNRSLKKRKLKKFHGNQRFEGNCLLGNIHKHNHQPLSTHSLALSTENSMRDLKMETASHGGAGHEYGSPTIKPEKLTSTLHAQILSHASMRRAHKNGQSIIKQCHPCIFHFGFKIMQITPVTNIVSVCFHIEIPAIPLRSLQAPPPIS